MKVKCVDASPTPNVPKPNVRVGEIYEAAETSYSYVIGGVYWNKSRFIKVDATTTSAPTTAQPVKKNVADEDKEEARLRAILTGPRPGNCGCNIPREQCDFHRTKKVG